MATLLSVRWGTPPPTSVDERLLVRDDGSARLDVLRPRLSGAIVGSFEAVLNDAVVRDVAAAVEAEGGDLVVDVVRADAGVAAVSVLADQVARGLMESPSAAAHFFVRPVGEGPDGSVTLAIGVLGRGERPVEFMLDPAECWVHVTSDGSSSSVPLPELPTGFSTVDAEGLGGVRRRAVVPPGVLGVISLELPAPPGGADVEVSVRLGGIWQLDPDAEPDEFALRTVAVPLRGREPR